MSIVNDTIQNGIRKSRVRDSAMPVCNRNLAGNQCGCVPEAVIKDFKNILCVLNRDRIAHPIIQYQ